MKDLVMWAPFLGILGLVFAGWLFLFAKKQPVGTPKMEEIAGLITETDNLLQRGKTEVRKAMI